MRDEQAPSPAQPGEGEAARAALIRATSLIPGDTPRLDAELLMAHGLGISREALLLGRLDARVPPGFEVLLARRIAHEPVAYILGRRGFWTIELEVGPGVLIPRPDSETLIEAAVAHFAGRPGPARVLDLGTGPGTLLLAALAQWIGATGIGVDRSAVALDYARRNADRLGLGGRASWREGDWADGIAERFDLLLCNPPYVAAGARLAPEVIDHEPRDALFAGEDGLDDYRRLAPMIAPLLAPGGVASIEVGAGQAAAVDELLSCNGLRVARHRDLGGHVRCLGCVVR